MFMCVIMLALCAGNDLVIQFLVKITVLYDLVAGMPDCLLCKSQIKFWKDRATVAG